MTDAASPRPFKVRPYVLTQGRTRPSVDLTSETQIRTTTAGQQACPSLRDESAAILRLCIRPVSIAEIAAHADIHLQVAKILVADLVSQGYASTGTTSHPLASRPDLRLLDQVLANLQSR